MEFLDPRFGKLRMVDQYGKQWFIVRDVMVGLRISSWQLLMKRVPDDHKMHVNTRTRTNVWGVDEDGLKMLLDMIGKDVCVDYWKWVESNMNPIRKTEICGDEQFGPIRVVDIDGEKWFIGKDVADCLGYKNPRDALQRCVANEDSQLVDVLTAGGQQKLKAINANGLASLVNKSAQPNKEEFAEWAMSKIGIEVADNALQVFNNEEFGKIRGVEIDGEAWFVGSDIAEQLGYEEPHKAVARHVDDEDKGVAGTGRFIPASRLPSNTVLINESGFYSLVLDSKLPRAKEFRRWVTHDVIPSIRKHGMYMTDATSEAVSNDPSVLLRKAADYLDEYKQKISDMQMALDIQNNIISDLKDEHNKVLDERNRQLIALLEENTRLRSNYNDPYNIMFIRLHRKLFQDFINKCVRSYATLTYGDQYLGVGWKDYYVKLQQVLGDDVRLRGDKPFINHITETEMPKALKLAGHMSVRDVHELVDDHTYQMVKEAIECAVA